MDWRLSKFDWNKARAFLVTVDEGSLSAGARALKTTQATLSRQVSSLENELGIILFERSGHKLVLTPNGTELAEYVRTMAEAAEQLVMTATSKRETVEGTICISANEFDAAYRLPHILKKLNEQHPEINVEVIATDNVSELKRREADIALRWFEPTQNELNSNKIGSEEIGYFASKEYLRNRGGEPKSLVDLEQHSFIGYDSTVRLRNVLRSIGLKLTVDNFPFLCESYLVQREYVRAGLGIGVFPVDIGSKCSDLIRLLPEAETLQYELWLVSHREFNTSQRIKTVYDLMYKELIEYFEKN